MRIRTTISLSLALALVSAVSWPKQSQAAHHHPAPNLKDRQARAATPAVSRSRLKRRRPTLAEAARHRRPATLPPQDRYVDRLHAIGPRQVGEAAWYGPRFLGRRTASGARLDTIHPTAAHRSLPLHSLVRITNLRNGRSAVAEINDRGPFKRSVLIDLSPRTARELDMIRAGLVPVVVVPVAEVDRSRQ